MATQTQSTTGVPHREVFPPFDAAHFGPQLLWLAVTFGLLYLVAAKVLLPRVGGILAARRDRQAGDLAEAQALTARSEEARMAYEKALGEARANATRLAQATRDGIARALDQKRVDLEAETARRVAEAEARIASLRDRALADVGAVAEQAAEAILVRVADVTAAPGEIAAALDGAAAR